MFLEHFTQDGKTQGWIEVVCGSMFSGKTEELLRRIKRARFANQKILLVKPSIDIRYSDKNVVSHQGTSQDAILVNSAEEILDVWKNEKNSDKLDYVLINGRRAFQCKQCLENFF